MQITIAYSKKENRLSSHVSIMFSITNPIEANIKMAPIKNLGIKLIKGNADKKRAPLNKAHKIPGNREVVLPIIPTFKTFNLSCA